MSLAWNCICGHEEIDHKYKFTIILTEPCTKCSCKDFHLEDEHDVK